MVSIHDMWPSLGANEFLPVEIPPLPPGLSIKQLLHAAPATATGTTSSKLHDRSKLHGFRFDKALSGISKGQRLPPSIPQPAPATITSNTADRHPEVPAAAGMQDFSIKTTKQSHQGGAATDHLPELRPWDLAALLNLHTASTTQRPTPPLATLDGIEDGISLNAPPLKEPAYTLTGPAVCPTGEMCFSLKIELPGVSSAAAVDVQSGDSMVDVYVKSQYSLKVPLQAKIKPTATRAKWNSRKQQLTLTLPTA